MVPNVCKGLHTNPLLKSFVFDELESEWISYGKCEQMDGTLDEKWVRKSLVNAIYFRTVTVEGV